MIGLAGFETSTQEHDDLEWFGPPERNTLHPLGEILLLVVYEPIICRAFSFTQPEVF